MSLRKITTKTLPLLNECLIVSGYPHLLRTVVLCVVKSVPENIDTFNITLNLLYPSVTDKKTFLYILRKAHSFYEELKTYDFITINDNVNLIYTDGKLLLLDVGE